MPRIPFDDDDGRFEAAEPPELSEAATHALARQQKLDDGNFIIERTLAFKNEMAAEFERAKRDGDSADPMFEPNIMKFGFEMRSSLLSDIPRGPRGRLISPDAIEKTRSNMESTMERFSTAALHRLNFERHQKAFANIEAAGEEFAKAAGRDARGLQSLLITVDNLMDRYEGVFADEEIAGQRARLRTGTVIAAINGLIEQGKTGFARELIQKGAFDPDLGDQPARLLLGRIAKTEKDNAFKAAEETVRARRLVVAEIGLRAGKGQLFPAELDAALAQGTIGAAEHADFLAEIERIEEDRDKRIEDMARVSDLLARGEKPDAEDPADRAAIDAKFEGLTAAFADRPPEERAFIETRFVRRTGMLPATLRDRLLSGMYSEDPAAQVTAAGRLDAFDSSDPTLTAEFPGDMLARARVITEFTLPGLTPARIVQLAAEKMAQQEVEVVQAEGEKAQEAEDEPSAEDIDDDDTPDLLGLLGELLFGGPAAAQSPRPLAKDVKALVKSDLSDEKLTAQAGELGLDADVVRLLRRMLNVTPESRQEVESEINKIFAKKPKIWKPFREVLASIADTDDRAHRESLIADLYESAIKDSQEGSPTVEEIIEILLPFLIMRGRKRPGKRPVPPKARSGKTGKDGDSSKRGKGGSAARRESEPTSRDARGITGRHTVGKKDPVLTDRTIVQPREDRTLLLRGAKEAKPDFDAKLGEIVGAVPNSRLEVGRMKGPDRLQEKIDELHDEMRDAGVEPASPDAGAHLIRDYLAGRLIPDDQISLDKTLAQVRRRFDIVDVKDFMKKPNPLTGYTAVHVQVKLPNGTTAELQIQPAPFKRAADKGRQIFEKYRRFGNKIPASHKQEYEADVRRSREIYARAWQQWISSGGKDVRVARPVP